jgi:hypothetical protein
MISDPRRQPHLAVERLVDLLVHVVALEHRQALGLGVVELDPVGELGVERVDVRLHLLVQLAVVDDDAAVVGVELLADDPHGELGLAVQQRRLGALGRLALDLLPLAEQELHVGLEVGLGGVLGRGAHDQAVLLGLDPVEHVAEPLAGVVGQPLRDAVGLRVRDQHHEPPGQRDLLGEPGTLGPDRVLRDLAHDHLPWP